jgi:uncharacterized protein (UPF0332 family)
MNAFERCLEERRLVAAHDPEEMIAKEVQSAEYDLQRARESLEKGDYKWASIQIYYSMFHSVKALVLKKGYREKSHYCLLVALRELYVETGELEIEYADNFDMAMFVRKEADYAAVYDEESAHILLDHAQEMIEMAQKMLNMH